ncbi:hypothetical protein VTN00DRAFT_4446 [Thermoascus crustaceus]|uniref:uncharacterized protein n=1 Tax=Thermoascus crustaceus TaxID=5088 RepID=UPI003742B4EC
MFRLLPWSSAIGGNKVMAEDLKMLAAPQQCRSSVLDGSALHKPKRKRAGSNEWEASMEGQAKTKLRLDNSNNGISLEVNNQNGASAGSPADGSADNSPVPNSQQVAASHPPMDGSAADHPQKPQAASQATAPPKMDIDKLRQTIEAQLSLEVLLKHNELRLIDQEIAKCQVALEQLRRCAEIPYPGSTVAGISQSVSEGTGAAVFPPGNGRAPLSPAPWGVTDGPYTRHYAKWLIPDPRFDGGEVDNGASLGQAPFDGRTTRASLGETGYVAGKSRSQRGSAGSKLQALSSGYPQPKDKAGPMIIRRKSDGQLVKLVCLDCRRDNFSSTQGFINHCRIAHNRNFASHDAAAVASGEPVEVDEAGMIIGGNNDSSNGAGAGYVHPLIRSAHMVESASKANLQPPPPPSDGQTPKRPSKDPSPADTPASDRGPKRLKLTTPVVPNSSFTASPDTPHLSSLMQQRGIGLDLSQIVGDAKTTVDIDAYSSEEESSEEAADTGVCTSHDRPQLSVRGGRQPVRTTVSQTSSQRPNSRKGHDKAGNKPRPLEVITQAPAVPYTSPYATTPTAPVSSQVDDSRDVDGIIDASANLSPDTVESNQAPSLVSDDDEYEAPSDSGSPSPSSSEAGNDDENFDHIEVEDDEGTATSTTTTTESKTDPGLASPAKRHVTPLAKSLKRGNGRKKDRVVSASVIPLNRGKDERRVSFAHPDTTPTKTKKDAGRKQH